LRGVKAVEQDGATAALGVTDFTCEDRFAGGFAATIELKVAIANHLDEL